MNNQMPFFVPNVPPYNKDNNNFEIDRLLNKINRLEKQIRILENRVNRLENAEQNNKNYYQDDPTDMYII